MPNFDAEISLEKPVIGVDEVGRGPLAGPVVSCACIFFDYSIPKDKLIILDDSKKLTRSKRLKAIKLIFGHLFECFCRKNCQIENPYYHR